MKKLVLHLLMVLMMVHVAYPQDAPKVALVLSGGGAKGLAHIGVLQALEQAGIYPDIITGTSMGSVIGGLYATGYSATEIEQITKKIKWEELLSNQVPLSHVAFEEKAYYGRYIAELPVIKNKPKLPQGLIEGQKLQEELSRLTRSAHTIRNFDELPIPFRAVATNIETGERVVLAKGSLPTAIRASMAIPTIFTPVRINDTLMVDGGLVRNFPVQEAIDLGADIIIGVFVSTDLEPLEELEDMLDILLQSSWVMSAYDSREQRKLVDVYIAPNLAEYGTLSFDQADSIIQRGKVAGSKFLDSFEKLRDSLVAKGKVFQKPVINQNSDTISIGQIEVAGNQQISDEFILGKLQLSNGDRIALSTLSAQIEKIYGTRYFRKIDYELKESSGKTDLKINVAEVVQTRLKGAVHYNNERKIGLNLNLTIRNKLLNNSRFITELDIAENPRVDVSYLKYTGVRQSYAATTGYRFTEFELPVFRTGNQLASFTYWNNQLFLTFQSTRNPIATAGFKIQGSKNFFRPKVSGALNSLNQGVEESFDVQLFWKHNSLDRQFFPRKGTEAGITIGYVPYNDLQIDLAALDSVVSNNILNTLSYPTFQFLKLNLTQYFNLTDAFSFFYGLNVSLNATNRIGLNYQGGIGGFFPNHSMIEPFWGAEFYEFTVPNYGILKAGFQWEILENFYLLGRANYLNTKYPLEWINPTQEIARVRNGSDLLGGGLGVGYDSYLGPLLVTAGKSSADGDWLFGINVGFWY